MNYLSRFEFLKLNDTEKKEYYDTLVDEKNEAVTVDMFEELILAFEALEGYGNSEHITDDIRKAAEKQRVQDNIYRNERKKKGLLMGVVAVATVVLVATVCIIVSMLG